MPEIGLFEAIYSARSLRRLKPDPVPEALITKILDAAIRAPVCRQCAKLGLCRGSRSRTAAQARRHLPQGLRHRRSHVCGARSAGPHLTEQQFARMLGAGGHLWEHIGEAPVLLVPCQRLPVVPPRESLPPDIAADYANELAYVDRIRGASIYPAVQNILLACRALGLGTVITTNHIRCEGEVKAVLGIPDDVATFALMPIGWPLDKFGPLTRRPPAEVSHADRWGTPWLG